MQDVVTLIIGPGWVLRDPKNKGYAPSLEVRYNDVLLCDDFPHYVAAVDYCVALGCTFYVVDLCTDSLKR